MVIPVVEVEAPILKMVIDFCVYYRKHEIRDISEDDFEKWETEFMDVEKAKLFALLRAANFLDIQPLLDLCCKTVAGLLKGKTGAQINEEFIIPPGTHLY